MSPLDLLEDKEQKRGGVAFEMEKAPTLRSGITSDVVYCVLNDQGGQ